MIHRMILPFQNGGKGNLPVEAPEGTAARKMPFSVVKSTSTVGFPRES